ncbi:MAG: YIP1 family protein [Lachnospiraceae bacterium]|nr:YIP1 family protein [Lachnospiraceae bacterium]
MANNSILGSVGGWFKNTFNAKYFDSLKFSLYCLTHPIDGFWDLTHEKRGTYAAANTILFLTIFIRILKLRYTSFIFVTVYWEELNIFLYIASILFPLALFVIGNWATTTLFDGKGKLGQVYIGTCYALTPYPLMQIPLMFLSNVVTVDEAEFYTVLSALSIVWCGILIVSAMGQIHEFSGAKNILFMIFSLFAMLVMIFILLLFFSMISQGVAYFVSLYKEFMFRA